ncbi:MAG TPA: RNA chaperone Hfq [Clostridiales bacterium]|nr:RNA chaperone Hfq [Clostridiales bacterium]
MTSALPGEWSSLKSQGNLQDGFLIQASKDSAPVIIYLVNGVQLKGQIRGFDSFTILLDSDGRAQMVYKHAISTIQMGRLPARTPIGEGAIRPPEGQS